MVKLENEGNYVDASHGYYGSSKYQSDGAYSYLLEYMQRLQRNWPVLLPKVRFGFLKIPYNSRIFHQYASDGPLHIERVQLESHLEGRTG